MRGFALLVLVAAFAGEARADQVKSKPEPVAVAIVMNGWELWIGNDKETRLTVDDPSRTPGILIMLRTAIDKADLKNAGPKGSVGMVITYDDKPRIRVPMSPLVELTGKKLGTQKDYFNVTGVEMVSGITFALAELAKRTEPRKVLIVIGDGNDTNNDVAKAHLAKLKKQAAQDRVQTFAITYKAKLSADGSVIPLMIPNAVEVTTAIQIETAFRDIVRRIAAPSAPVP